MRVYPDYYKDFKCIGGACRHNCCIGWEIDIDEETLALYDSLEGAWGERFQKNIDRCDTPHFILGKEERCPFLNKQNLCDIIAELGEDCLCDICAAHPRFVNEIPSDHETDERIELGLGLCCEAAGALILGQQAPMRLSVPDGVPTSPVIKERDALIALLQRRELPMAQRLKEMTERYGVTAPFDPVMTARRYLALERLEEGWETHLKRLFSPVDPAPLMAERETEYEQLAVYLIYRHFVCHTPAAVAAFTAEAVQLVAALGAAQYADTGRFDFADQVELCRAFSAEIEYSEENIKALI